MVVLRTWMQHSSTRGGRRMQSPSHQPPPWDPGSLCAGMLTPAGPVRECSVTDSQGAAGVMEAERPPVEAVCVDFRMLTASCGVAEVLHLPVAAQMHVSFSCF